MDAKRHSREPLGDWSANERHELFMFEDSLDHSNAIRPFGMAGSIVMREAGRMRNQQCIQFKPANSVFPSRAWRLDLVPLKSKAVRAGATILP